MMESLKSVYFYLEDLLVIHVYRAYENVLGW